MTMRRMSNGGVAGKKLEFYEATDGGKFWGGGGRVGVAHTLDA